MLAFCSNCLQVKSPANAHPLCMLNSSCSSLRSCDICPGWTEFQWVWVCKDELLNVRPGLFLQSKGKQSFSISTSGYMWTSKPLSLAATLRNFHWWQPCHPVCISSSLISPRGGVVSPGGVERPSGLIQLWAHQAVWLGRLHFSSSYGWVVNEETRMCFLTIKRSCTIGRCPASHAKWIGDRPDPRWQTGAAPFFNKSCTSSRLPTLLALKHGMILGTISTDKTALYKHTFLPLFLILELLCK